MSTIQNSIHILISVKEKKALFSARNYDGNLDCADLRTYIIKTRIQLFLKQFDNGRWALNLKHKFSYILIHFYYSYIIFIHFHLQLCMSNENI